ncbi:MAG: nucleoside triphosphate pyrophosphohydrolase family protein, partial [Bacteroidota bacterium]
MNDDHKKTPKFEEANALNDVAKFHETFDLPILSTPTIPDEDRCKLRINLLQEELNELKDAIENRDIVEIADALADLQYVLSGAVLEFGLSSRFKVVFDEVQRSNMSKTCKTMEEAKATQVHYLKDDLTLCIALIK